MFVTVYLHNCAQDDYIYDCDVDEIKVLTSFTQYKKHFSSPFQMKLLKLTQFLIEMRYVL